jgi:hypothetical protein
MSEKKELKGRYLELYQFVVRTHVNNGIVNGDEKYASLFPKFTMLALSPEFRSHLAHDIILAKQLQEMGLETSEETFERTTEIGRRLADKYLYERNPELRPNENEFSEACERVRKFQSDESKE